MNVLELKRRLYSAMKAEIEVCQADAGHDLETLEEKPAAEEPPSPREITLEEWIEATQSCCGVDHDVE